MSSHYADPDSEGEVYDDADEVPGELYDDADEVPPGRVDVDVDAAPIYGAADAAGPRGSAEAPKVEYVYGNGDDVLQGPPPVVPARGAIGRPAILVKNKQHSYQNDAAGGGASGADEAPPSRPPPAAAPAVPSRQPAVTVAHVPRSCGGAGAAAADPPSRRPTGQRYQNVPDPRGPVGWKPKVAPGPDAGFTVHLIPRDEGLAIIKVKKAGDFFIRKSASTKGAFVIVVKLEHKVQERKIAVENGKWLLLCDDRVTRPYDTLADAIRAIPTCSNYIGHTGPLMRYAEPEEKREKECIYGSL